MRHVTVRDIVDRALDGRDVFETKDKRICIKLLRYDLVKVTYALPQARAYSFGFYRDEGMMDMTEHDLTDDMRFIFSGIVLKELGLPEDGLLPQE